MISVGPEAASDAVYEFRRCAACWETVGVVGQTTVDDGPY
jgi:hypothetical protein